MVSCGQTNENKSESKTKSINQASTSQSEFALRFINEYVANCNKMKNAIGIAEWGNSNNLATENFKTELTRIVTEANENNLDSGLDFDPIFDGQDYPEKGFDLESIDKSSDFLIVQGIDWNQFRLSMKVKNINGEWLVDGCGIVNIPNNQRVEK